MELNLPTLMTGEQLTAWAAEIAILIGVAQRLSWVPMPEGSRVRAWAVSLLALAITVLMAIGTTSTDLPALVAAGVISWAGLSSAALGLNRAGSYTYEAAKARVEEPPVADYDPNQPQG